MQRVATAVLVLLLLLPGASACSRGRDEAKIQRILARDDRRLTDVVAAWLARPGAAESPAEHAVADAVHVFAIVGDSGLAPFVDTAPGSPDPDRALAALQEVGLPQHAKILDELLAARMGGKVPPATLIALEDRFRALPDPAPTLATYIRRHASELRLDKANEKAIP